MEKLIFQTILDDILSWIFTNLPNIILVAVVIVIGWIIYLVIKKQINRLRKKEKLEESTAKNLQRLVKIIVVLIIISTIMIQFVEAIGLLTSLFTLMGGTIIGFAAINTIGNTIAGFIIMVSRPFTSGDYIIHDGKLAKVEEIKLIFTVLRNFDRVKISVPNQKLLTDEVENLGKINTIRRKIIITADYQEDRLRVEKALIEAAENVQSILKEPKPFVRITNFLNFAVEYTLFVFINEIRAVKRIEGNLHASILDTMNKYNIDISTPSLIKESKMKGE
ncbi:MAG: mechanosensitive ion channel family protein [Candidatus Thorarchaeota archaeon]